MFFSLLCLLCLCMRLFICALWSPAGKGLASWLSFVVSNCEFVTFPLVSWVRCGTWLFRFLIFAPLLTLVTRRRFADGPTVARWGGGYVATLKDGLFQHGLSCLFSALTVRFITKRFIGEYCPTLGKFYLPYSPKYAVTFTSYSIWASTRENLSSGVCKQYRRRPACASAQSDQRLCCSVFGNYHM